MVLLQILDGEEYKLHPSPFIIEIKKNRQMVFFTLHIHSPYLEALSLQSRTLPYPYPNQGGLF